MTFVILFLFTVRMYVYIMLFPPTIQSGAFAGYQLATLARVLSAV